MNRLLLCSFLCALVVTGTIFAPAPARAADINPATSPSPTLTANNPAQTIVNLYQYAFWLAVILAFATIVWAGFKIVLSGGNPSAQSDAKDQITQSLLGLLLLAGAFVILNTLDPNLTRLRLPGLAPLTPVTGTNYTIPLVISPFQTPTPAPTPTPSLNNCVSCGQSSTGPDVTCDGKCLKNGVEDTTRSCFGVNGAHVCLANADAKVTLCAEKNYGAPCMDITGDVGYVGDSMNDQISSILSPQNIEVGLYDDINFGGKCHWFSKDTFYVGDEANDKASSIKIGAGACSQ